MENPPEAHIRERIARLGKITFAEFMELALYHPMGGYYTSASGIGAAGDYFTSPAAHPAFGALIAVQLQRMWEVLGCPARFYAVEIGAGSGLLARDVVDYAARMPGAFAQSLRYIALERYDARVPLAAETGNIQRVIAGADGVPFGGVVGCFISNELVDSLPVHRFQIHQGAVNEVYVALDERGRFVEVLGEPSTPMLSTRLNDLGLSLPDGFQGEVRLNTRSWLGQISDALARGFVVTIDYGHEAKELYAHGRAMGTLQTYYRHTQGGNPYQRIGQQDITAHVDFSLVASEGEALGLRPLGLLSQSSFLKGLGFDRMLRQLRAKRLSQRQRDANVMAMLELVRPGGLGAFKVLIQERATVVEDVAQLAPSNASEAAADVPLLGPEHIPLMEGRYPHMASGIEDLWPFNEEALLGVSVPPTCPASIRL